MIPLLIFFIELAVLYVLATRLTQAVYDLTILLFRSRPIGIMVVSLLTFPGTVVHELSHLFTAEVLGVHTGKLTLVPENIQDEEVKAGSVMIAQSDPFRRYMIGLAPIFSGLICITALSYLLVNPSVIPVSWGEFSIFNIQFSVLSIIFFYLLFAVSNAMFSSSEDLKGFIPFAIALGAMIAAAYVAGLRIGLTGFLLDTVTTILFSLTKSLGIVLAVNIFGLLVTKGLIIIAEKFIHRRIIRR